MIERIIRWSAEHRGLVIGAVMACALWGAWILPQVPLDAFPELSEPQVIVYSRWERSPDVIEDQVTYPLVTAMQGLPHVRTVRGVSDFGYSFVYVLFDDDIASGPGGADAMALARARVQERLGAMRDTLPDGVQSLVGPDATGLGWVYQYALADDSGTHSPADLRHLQDDFLRYALRALPGVADVATVGGVVSQYQVVIDPARMRALGIPLSAVTAAVRASNLETAGRTLEFGGTEYMIRGHGSLETPEQLADAVVSGSVRVRDIATVTVGADMRRGVADLDGRETVSGIVIMRPGANVLEVTDAVSRRLSGLSDSLPPGVRVVPVYDRSHLVRRVIANLGRTLAEIALAVVFVILLFLWDLPSAIVPIVTIPLTVLAVAVPFHLLGYSFNIMSLAGIGLAIGALVDAAIVVVEQTHKKLEQEPQAAVTAVVVQAVSEVGRPAFFALVIMAVAFLPVLALEGQQGRLFHPLALAKSLTMAVAAVLTITLDPALRVWLARVRPLAVIRPEAAHPLSRWLVAAYTPVLSLALRHKTAVAAIVICAGVLTIPVARQLGTELVPPLDEGVLLYMPTTAPGMSIAEATRLLQRVDAMLSRQPEVERVLGKAGRAETATDPAPLSMLETLVVLKPRDQWPVALSTTALIDKYNAVLALPGVANAWSMPIRGRIDMLATGIRSPLGLKVSGSDLATVARVSAEAEAVLRGVPGTRSVFAERLGDGRYIDITWDRAALARSGLTMDVAQAAVQQAIGGESVTTVVRGRARYPVNIRLPRDARDNLDALAAVLVSGENGRDPVALGQLATIRVVNGPAMIRDENGQLTGYVYLDIGVRDPAGYVSEASAALASRLTLPSGATVTWSGQYESFARVNARLWLVIPLTLGLVAVLLFLSTRSLAKTALVLLAVPFSAIGAVWSLYLLGYPVSPAVWVGIIALLGVDAETGMFMVLYLDLAWQARARVGRLVNASDRREAILSGAVSRIRPKFMTVATMFIGLVPILWASGPGSEVMKRIAAPMVGGLATSFVMELLVYPLLYEWWYARAPLRACVSRHGNVYPPAAAPALTVAAERG